MTRSLGLPLLLVTVSIAGFLFVRQTATSGPTSAAVTQAETQAVVAVAGTNFQAGDAAMQAALATNGTYAGAELPAGSGLALVRADATSYCLQTIAGEAVEHEVGPNGTAQPGPC